MLSATEPTVVVGKVEQHSQHRQKRAEDDEPGTVLVHPTISQHSHLVEWHAVLTYSQGSGGRKPQQV